MGFQNHTNKESAPPVGIPLLVLILALFVISIATTAAVSLIHKGSIQGLESRESSITRWYEDGSGRIKLSNGYCVFPAFDSPGDKVECVITDKEE